MRYTDPIGSLGDYIEHQLNRPKYYACPECGKKGKRKRVVERFVKHIGPLNRQSFIHAKVGVYKSRCSCCEFFQAHIEGVPYKGRYSYAVRDGVANAVIRDRMPYALVQNKMAEDHFLELSIGYVHFCFLWAHEQINMGEHWDFVLSNFSGVLCIDEVHDGDWTLLFATDPLNDFTVSFSLVEQNDQDNMDAFLQALKDQGLDVVVAITDGSPLYKDSLQTWWKDIQHQLCVFHVIKEVNKLILSGVRDIKNRIKRQGNKGRKRRPGRPTKKARQQRQAQKGRTKKEQAAFIWEHQYLIVKKQENLTDQEEQDLKLMFEIAPELKLFRQFNHQFYRLFQKGITTDLSLIYCVENGIGSCFWYDTRSQDLYRTDRRYPAACIPAGENGHSRGLGSCNPASRQPSRSQCGLVDHRVVVLHRVRGRSSDGGG